MAVAAAAVRPAAAGSARWLTLIGLVTAGVMEVLDTTIVNVALPQMMGNLGATPDEIGWVATSYILANVTVLPITAWLASFFGRKRYLIGSMTIFVAASFFCGHAHSLAELVLFRVMQGAGGAALLSTAQATLVEIFPREQQGMVQALFGLGLVVAPTVAPALGGYIVDNYNWPWVFYVNLPVGAVAIFLVASFLPEMQHRRALDGAIDFVGIGLLAVGMASLQYVLEEGNRNEWFDSMLIVRLAIIAAVGLLVFVYWELRPANLHPVVELRVLTDRGLASGLVLQLMLGFGLYGGVFILPMFLQNVLHFTAFQTGLVLLPGGVATAIGMILVGRMLDRGLDPRSLIGFGIVVFCTAMWQLGHLTLLSGEPQTRAALIIRGFALGFLFIPITVAAFAGLQGTAIAQGSALLNLSRQVGGSFGIAVLSTYVSNMYAYHRSILAAHVFHGNPMLAQRLAAITRVLVSHGYGYEHARAAAMKAIDYMVTAQAYTMSYNDGFLMLGLAFFLASPTVLLLRRPRRAGAGGPGMLH